MWNSEKVANGHVWILNENQRSEAWFRARTGRVSGSNVSGAIGDSPFSTPEETALTICGLKKVELNDAMKYGIEHEIDAIRWYRQTTNYNVRDVGFMIPDWDTTLGASPDSLVEDDGLLEIKCPKKMYKRDIFLSHYQQIQTQLIISGRQWCDYLVFCIPENSFSIKRINIDYDYWNNYIYPKIKEFQKECLFPLMEEYNIKMEFPC